MQTSSSAASSTFLDDQLSDSDWIFIPKMASSTNTTTNKNNSPVCDFPPHPIANDKLTPPSRPQSHQSGTIINHWNDLPQSFIPSNSSSRSATPARNAPSPLSATVATSTDSATRFPSDGKVDDDLKPLSVLLSGLYNMTTTLSDGEHKMMQARLDKLSPGIKGGRERFLRELLQSFVVRGEITPGQVREELVAFMMREQGVAAWATWVRKLAESVVVQ